MGLARLKAVWPDGFPSGLGLCPIKIGSGLDLKTALKNTVMLGSGLALARSGLDKKPTLLHPFFSLTQRCLPSPFSPLSSLSLSLTSLLARSQSLSSHYPLSLSLESRCIPSSCSLFPSLVLHWRRSSDLVGPAQTDKLGFKLGSSLHHNCNNILDVEGPEAQNLSRHGTGYIDSRFRPGPARFHTQAPPRRVTTAGAASSLPSPVPPPSLPTSSDPPAPTASSSPSRSPTPLPFPAAWPWIPPPAPPGT